MRLARRSNVGDERSRDLLRWLSPWLPVSLGGLGALVVLVRLPHIIGVLYTDGDVASAPVIAALAGHAPGSRAVLLGQFPWYESLWFMRLTHGLPGYREIWRPLRSRLPPSATAWWSLAPGCASDGRGLCW